MYLSLLMSLLACSTVTPGIVYVGVDVCGNKPELERYEVLHGGRIWSSPCMDWYPIPVREQRAVWSATSTEGATQDESITFAGIDGQSLNIDVSIGYRVADEDKDIIEMVRTYGPELDQIIHTRVRDSVRNDLNMCAADETLTVQDIYGAKKAGLFTCAEERAQKEYAVHGLVITRVTLNSEIRLPPQVKEAMEKAQAATQDADRVTREVQQTRAEGEKTKAAAEAEASAKLTRAHAEAEANQITTQAITPAILEMKRLDIELTRAKAWDGKLPSTVLGSDTNLMFGIQK